MELKQNCIICGKKCERKDNKYCSVKCYRSKLRKKKEVKMKLCKICKKRETQSMQSYYCFECCGFINKNEKRVHNIGAKRRSLRYYNLHKNDTHFKEYRKKYIREYQRRKLNQSNIYKVQMRIRNYVNYSLNKYSKNGKIMSCNKYGIDVNKIIENLKPFPDDIENYHIDHIIPLSSFNLNNLIQVKMAFYPENLRWLKSSDNISKSNKIIPNFVGFKQMFDNY